MRFSDRFFLCSWEDRLGCDGFVKEGREKGYALGWCVEGDWLGDGVVVREGFFGFGLGCCGLYVVLAGEKSVGVSSLKEGRLGLPH